MSKRSKEASSSGAQAEEVARVLINGLLDEMAREILQSLPSNIALGRCRAVSPSWRQLLKDPGFIRKFAFQNTDLWNDLQLVIQRRQNGRSVYSFHSHGSLAPISGPAHLDQVVAGNYEILCGTRGIFCLTDGGGNGNELSNIVLWNPANSQTRRLPVSNFAEEVGGYPQKTEAVGFCFDPEQNDYKVVRTLICYDENNDEDQFCELYSVQHGAWRILPRQYGHDNPHCIHYSVPSSDGRLCYWRGERLQIISFDVSSEEFKDLEMGITPTVLNDFSVQSVSFVKGSIVAIFSDGNVDLHLPNELQTWMFLHFEDDLGEWILLSTIKSDKLKKCMLPVGMWKDKRCFLQRYDDGQLVVVDLEDGKSVPVELKIEGEWRSFKAFSYTPSEVQLV